MCETSAINLLNAPTVILQFSRIKKNFLKKPLRIEKRLMLNDRKVCGSIFEFFITKTENISLQNASVSEWPLAFKKQMTDSWLPTQHLTDERTANASLKDNLTKNIIIQIFPAVPAFYGTYFTDNFSTYCWIKIL